MLFLNRYGRKVIHSVRIVLLVIFFLGIRLAVSAQSPVIDLPYGKMKAGELIRIIDSNIHVSWTKKELDSSVLVDVNGPAPLNRALHELTDPFHRGFTVIPGKQVFIELGPRPAIDSISCTVSVFDQTGERLPLASLRDILSRRVYYSNKEGVAVIKIPRRTLTLAVSYVGMRDDSVTFFESGSREVRLKQSNSSLDEEVVKGYVDAKRRYLVGDWAKVDSDRFRGDGLLPLPRALEGQVAGLLVTQTSGMPGASSYITLRGQGSIYNDCAPLIIIDGTIFVPGNKSMLSLAENNSGGSIDPLSLLFDGEIESIDVLKDADATAIYGSRGANGVILITTRRSRTRITEGHLEYSLGVGQVARRLPLMNTAQYLAMRNDAFRDDQPAVSRTPANATDLDVWDTTKYTDWSRYFIGGLSRINSLHGSLAGGNEHDHFFLGLGGLHETTVFPDFPTHKCLDGNLHLDHHSANDKFTMGLSAVIGFDQNNQILNFDPTFFTVLAPDAPNLKNPDGSLYVSSVPNSPWINPLSLLAQRYQSLAHNYLLSLTTQYNIRSWLVFKANIGFNNVVNNESGGGSSARTSYTGGQIEPQLEIKKKFGKLSINNIDGFSWQRIAANVNPLPDSSVIPTNYNYRAFFSRICLNYDNTYLLDLTGRLDGTNRFGPDIRYAPFYAVGGAWIFSELLGRNHVMPFLSFGKLNANIGITGNDQIGDHRESGYAPTNAPRFFNIPGFFSSNQVAAGTSWETILKEEIAFQLGFKHDRYLLTLAWYNHQSRDQLLPLSFPVPGAQDVFKNWPAVVRNTGWEFTVSARLIENHDLSWTVDLNWSLPVNRLVSFPGLAQTPLVHNLVVGQSVDIVQGWHYTGVDPATGIFTFQGRNHESVISDSNKMVIGHLDPRGFGGLFTTIRYRRFRVEVLVDARIITGINYLAAFYTDNPPGSLNGGFFSNAPIQLTARWKKPYDHAVYQQVITNNAGQIGDAIAHYTGSDAGLLANASFCRVKRLQFSYTIPTVSWIGRQGSGITFFLAGQNLITYSPGYKHVDPEVQSGVTLPPLRVLEGGVRLAL